MQGLVIALLAASAWAIAIPGHESEQKRAVIPMLPPAGDPDEERYQPLTDFDPDGCYYTSAIDIAGNTNPGLQVEPAGVGPFDTNISPSNLCRENSRLLSNNVYSRKRCNNGWCAIMYEYYFEKDISPAGVGAHVHDWENIIVFVKDGKVQRAISSCHGKYEDDGNTVVMEGDRVKFVYHAPESQTHCFRRATEGDSGTQNAQGKWFLGNLVGWNHWPLSLDGYSLRDRMFTTWSSGVAPKLWDFQDTFTKNLESAAGGAVEGLSPVSMNEGSIQVFPP